jgi:DNA-binding HxlR family transcriptional regulator
LGDPWTLLVLRDIIFGNRRHFRELLTQSEEGIASNILSARLKELVEAELLTRGPCAVRKLVAAGQAAYLYSLMTPPSTWVRRSR